MKQFNYEIKNPNEIHQALYELEHHINSFSYSSLLFHLYSINFSDEEILQIQNAINIAYPDATIGGTSTNGDICDGHLNETGMVVSVSAFEGSTATSQIYKCPQGYETILGEKICNLVDNDSSIKAIEILITLKVINSSLVLSEIEKCRNEVIIFGGGSAAADIADAHTKVINNNSVVHSGILIILYRGNDLHIDVHHAIGWKPLGKDFTVTKINGKRLFELDNIPAGKIYSRYLGINADDDFFSNILEFPFMTYQHGHEVLRMPFSCRKDDDSILLAGNLSKGATVNLSYGDPEVIRGDVTALKNTVNDFAPQAIFLYSCGVRRYYWKYLINKETSQFSAIAPVAGFYSAGEIMRMDSYIIEHHVTLIAISMREGEKITLHPSAIKEVDLNQPEEYKLHNQISMVRRLANFINVTTSDLKLANEELQQLADTDELTGIYNRRMIDQLCKSAISRANKYNLKLLIGIVDIDDFKEVNDTYGHDIGDIVLKGIAKALFDSLEGVPGSFFGRWGGEEFFFLIPNVTIESVIEMIEERRVTVSNIKFDVVGSKTLSIGMTEFKKGDNLETIFKRADDALYEAKNTGKNKICVKKA